MKERASPMDKRHFSIKRFLPRTLFGRSLLILITPVLLIQVITTYVFFERHWSKMTGRLSFAVAGEVALAVNDLENIQGDGAAETALRMLDYRDYLDLQIKFTPGTHYLEDPKAKPLVGWENMVAERLSQELQMRLDEPFVLDFDFPNKWIKVFVHLPGGLMEIGFPVRRIFSSSGYVFLLWVLGSSLLLLIVAIMFMRNQIRPIRRLAVAAERFGRGHDVPAFRPSGAREVRQAAQAFIDMHKRIKRQVEQRTTMLAGVSHDLRTPLTRMKLHLEMMRGNEDVEDLKKDIQEMERMIEGYLEFVRGEGDENPVMTGLLEFLNKVVRSAERQGLKIDFESGGEDIHLMLRPMAFERALSNIIDNAGKHAGRIWISISRGENAARIVIEDDGPGIPEAQYEEVFRPFYRVDTSRNAATGGVGLGLPIAMDIVHGHGGKITLGDSSHGGLKVTVSVPL